MLAAAEINIMKKLLTITTFAAALIFGMGVAHAATEQVSFDTSGGALNVSGTCSGRYALVVIRRAADNSIWGSSNPDCVQGAYTYSIPVSDADRQGGTFKVQVFDEASADGTIPVSSAGNGMQPVVFTAVPVTTDESTATIVIDTSSIATTTDESFLDDTLSNIFGIVMNVGDAVQSFTTIFANTVKASLVATVQLFAKTITLLPGGSINVPTGANQTAGSNWLGAGVTDVFIPNASVATSSEIIVSPTSPAATPLSVTDKTPGVGFHVTVLSPQPQAISFDWLVVQTYAASAPAQSQSVSSGGGGGGGGGGGSAMISPPTDSGDSGGGVIVDTTDTSDASTTIDASTTEGNDTTTIATDTVDSASSTTDAIDTTDTTGDASTSIQ
jgi:hypothetical protein